MTDGQKALELSSDQVEALKRIRAWWNHTDDQTFALAGYAGTGKTTVISALTSAWEGDVVIGAPTGKAAARLREKGVTAFTIHQLAYKLVDEDEDGNPLFDYTGLGDAASVPLVVIDEASMVNQRMYDDLVGGGYRMLFVGDHGQLAPVGGDPGIMRRPDFKLSVIHRQDDDGLLTFAHALRMGSLVPDSQGAAEALWMHPGHEEPAEARDRLVEADTAICWKNRTRHDLNLRIMQLRGLVPQYGKHGELGPGKALRVLDDLRQAGTEFPVVCLRNDYRHQVFNGEVYVCRVDRLRDESVWGELDGRPVIMDLAGFFGDKPGKPQEGHVLFDFGSCLTCHKSQGSEWDRVTVWDDTHAGMEGRERWAYTAATRAKKGLTWLHR